jgi:hypothetical protein
VKTALKFIGFVLLVAAVAAGAGLRVFLQGCSGHNLLC